MIYVPDKENYKCFVVQSEGVIRAYEQVPTNNSTIYYRDYYVNSDYMYRDGSQTFATYTILPTCLSSSDITTDIYYRVDFYKSLIMFIIIAIIGFIIPIKIIKRLFRRFN